MQYYTILSPLRSIQNPHAQVEYSLDPTKDSRWYMPSLYYKFQHTIPGSDVTVDFFMLYVVETAHVDLGCSNQQSLVIHFCANAVHG